MNATINRDTAANIAAVEDILVGGQPAAAPTADALSFHVAAQAHEGSNRGGTSSC